MPQVGSGSQTTCERLNQTETLIPIFPHGTNREHFQLLRKSRTRAWPEVKLTQTETLPPLRREAHGEGPDQKFTNEINEPLQDRL